MSALRRGRLTAFDSPELDALADRMGASRFLWSDVHRRYFKTQKGILASTTGRAVRFGAVLYEMMTPEQRLAVAGHEFVHVRERDPLHNFVYLRLPPLVVWAAVWIWAFFQPDPWFEILILLLYTPVAVFYGPFWLKLLAAKHFREVELRCDSVAAQYIDGEALISALQLSDSMFNPPSVKNTRRYRNLSKLYPTLEERAEAIRRSTAAAKENG